MSADQRGRHIPGHAENRFPIYHTREHRHARAHFDSVEEHIPKLRDDDWHEVFLSG
ncbi:MAG: hypothetical protein C5S47_00115 [Candidatus Methanogasteraceae archaeon]|nr:MAG: hypothetical protein C5S47_00115 [ANME-2 cluster archaeon]